MRVEMERVGVFLVVSVLLGGAWVDAQQADKGHYLRDLKAIEQLEKTDAIAAKANDVDVLTSLWTEDGVLIQPMSPPIVGRSNIRALLEQQKQRGASVHVLSYEEDWKERQIQGDNAFEWGKITVWERSRCDWALHRYLGEQWKKRERCWPLYRRLGQTKRQMALRRSTLQCDRILGNPLIPFRDVPTE